MKNILSVLRTLLWCFWGVFIGRAIYQVWDYRAHPFLYELSSAPWYTSILVNGAFTLIVTAILLLAIYFVKKAKRND